MTGHQSNIRIYLTQFRTNNICQHLKAVHQSTHKMHTFHYSADTTFNKKQFIYESTFVLGTNKWII